MDRSSPGPGATGNLPAGRAPIAQVRSPEERVATGPAGRGAAAARFPQPAKASCGPAAASGSQGLRRSRSLLRRSFVRSSRDHQAQAAAVHRPRVIRGRLEIARDRRWPYRWPPHGIRAQVLPRRLTARGPMSPRPVGGCLPMSHLATVGKSVSGELVATSEGCSKPASILGCEPFVSSKVCSCGGISESRRLRSQRVGSAGGATWL